MISNENLPALFSFSTATIITLTTLIAVCINPKIPDSVVNGAFGIASILAAGGAGAAHSSKRAEQENKYYSPSVNVNQPKELENEQQN